MAGEEIQVKGGQTLVIGRIFDAPREMVWKAWTEPELIMGWWGPKNFTAPFCTIDFRVGGSYLFCMRSPEGKDYWSTGVFREIVPFERIVATDSFADEKGNVVPASHYGLTSNYPLELLLTLTFEDQDGKTRLALGHVGHPASDIEDARQGWNESLDKLSALLQEIKGRP